MRHLSSRVIGVGLAASLLTLPVLAHKTEVSGDVAGIWHLEPNHSPKAGEPSRVWVALTQRGGKVIPLEQCDCQLSVYEVGENEDFPVLQPELEAISAESFQGIPGAEVTFPDLGEYRLVLTGNPQGEATFAPFELSYTTVVAAGRNRSADNAREPDADNSITQPENSPAPETIQASGNEDALTQTGEPSLEVTHARRALPWLVGAVVVASAVVVLLRLRARQLD